MPPFRKSKEVAELEAAARRAAHASGAIMGSIQINHLEIDFLADDDEEGIPSPRSKAANDLRRRFLDRLAALMSGAHHITTAIVALMRESVDTQTVDIWLASNAASHQQQQPQHPTLLTSLGKTLGRVRLLAATGEPRHAPNELWDLVIQGFHTRIQRYLGDIRATFTKHDRIFEDFITKLFGVFDEAPAELDRELGGKLTALRSQVCTSSPADWADQRKCKNILQQVADIYKLQYVEDRLKFALGKSTLSRELYLQISQLARPRRTFDTIIRTVRTFSAFSAVSIRYGMPPSTITNPPTSPESHSPTRSSPASSVAQKSAHVSSVPTTTENPSQMSSTEPAVAMNELFLKARIYLSAADKNVGPVQLRPFGKRQSFLLTACLLGGRNPAPDWNTYYSFGYSACENEDECQILGGLYNAILSCGDSQTIFAKLWQALEQHALVTLFDEYGYGEDFRAKLPTVERFLRTPPERRETVWNLVRFVRTDSTNPSQSLLRDYGYSFCKTREQVTLLKETYEGILRKLRPLQLHELCIRGKLCEAAEFFGMVLTPEQKRLLHNQGPIAQLGYEDVEERGLFSNRIAS